MDQPGLMCKSKELGSNTGAGNGTCSNADRIMGRVVQRCSRLIYSFQPRVLWYSVIYCSRTDSKLLTHDPTRTLESLHKDLNVNDSWTDSYNKIINKRLLWCSRVTSVIVLCVVLLCVVCCFMFLEKCYAGSTLSCIQLIWQRTLSDSDYYHAQVFLSLHHCFSQRQQ